MNYKKILSFILLLTILLPSAVALAEEQPLPERIQFLKDEGYISGRVDDGVVTYALDETITRTEMAKLVSLLIYQDEDIIREMGEGPSLFPDVGEDHWGKHYINFVAKSGAITGYEDGTFRPGENITFAELSAILVRLNDEWDDDREQAAGLQWPDGFIDGAEAFGLLAHVGRKPAGDILLRQDAFEMMYNAVVQKETVADDEDEEDDLFRPAPEVQPENGEAGNLLDDVDETDPATRNKVFEMLFNGMQYGE